MYHLYNSAKDLELQDNSITGNLLFSLNACYCWNNRPNRWLEKAANQGYAKAQYSLASCYNSTNNNNEDTAKSIFWHQEAAKQGCVDSTCQLAMIYTCLQNAIEAKHWLTKATELKAEESELNIAYGLYNFQFEAAEKLEKLDKFALKSKEPIVQKNEIPSESQKNYQRTEQAKRRQINNKQYMQ